MTKKNKMPPDSETLSKEEQQKLAIRVRTILGAQYQWAGPLLYSLKIRITDKRQSYTDGKTLVLSSYYRKYPKIGMKFIGAHELGHPTLHHLSRFAALTRSKNKAEMFLYNILGDSRINTFIGDEWASSECNAEWACIENELVTEDNVDEVISKGLFKAYPNWKDYLPRKGEELDYKKIDKTFDIIRNIKLPNNPFDNPSQIPNIITITLDKNGGKITITLDENPEDWGDDEQETKETENTIRGHIERGLADAKMRGVGSSKLMDTIDGIWNTPKVNWMSILKNYIRSQMRDTRTWGRLHKKSTVLPQIMPGFHPKKKYKLMIGIDTSGSMNKEELHLFLGEIYWMLKKNNAEAEVVMFDDGIRKKSILKKKSDIEALREVEGRGGTSFTELFEYATEKKIKDLVVMTDGCGDQDTLAKPSFNVHWVVDNSNFHFPFGKRIEISHGD